MLTETDRTQTVRTEIDRTETDRKETSRIPFLARRRKSRLTFMPILIAFFAMSTILCLFSLYYHSTLPHSDVESARVPPKSTLKVTHLADEVPNASPLLLP